MRVCENSPLCSAGYHYSFPGSVSYCVPLNTTFYGNSDFRRQLLDPSVSKTKIGRQGEMSVFVDTRRYPSKVSTEVFLFHGTVVFLVQKTGEGDVFYLGADFRFTTNDRAALPLRLNDASSLMTDFDIRLVWNSEINFLRANEPLVLVYSSRKQEWEWRLFGDIKSFRGRMIPPSDIQKTSSFVDDGDSFYLFLNTGEFLYRQDETNQLRIHPLLQDPGQWEQIRSKALFSFEKDKINQRNQIQDLPWEDYIHKMMDWYVETMDKDACLYFPYCHEENVSGCKQMGGGRLLVWIGMILLMGLVAVLVGWLAWRKVV